MVDPVGRRGAHDGPDVVGRLHAVEQQGQAARRAAVPLPVQALEVGRAQLPHGRRHLAGSGSPASTRPGSPPSPRRRARRPASRRPDAGAPPARPAHSGSRRGNQVAQQFVEGGLADPDRRVGPDPGEPDRQPARPPGRTGRTPGRPRAAALRAVRSRARSLMSTAHTTAPGARWARVQAIGP